MQDGEAEGGAKLDDVDWGDTKPCTRDYFVKWTLTLQTFPDASVTIKDCKGNIEFEGKAGKDGLLKTPLTQFYMSRAGKETRTPHQIFVKTDSEAKETSVSLAKPTKLTLR